MKSNAVHESIYHKLAQYYDTMHKEHPYKAQTDFADTAFQKYGTAGRCVLDICCGTGGHAEYMVEKGYDITGIDMSQDMLAVAERKFLSRARRPSFIQRDVTKLDSDEEFDGAYCFNAFFHMTTYEMATGLLKGVWRWLKEGGVFIFDVLNGWPMFDTMPKMHTAQEGETIVIEFHYSRTIDKMKRVKRIESLWLIQENGHVSLGWIAMNSGCSFMMS